MSKHTPGPWKFGYTDNIEHPIIMGADGEIVCVMHEGVSTEDGKLLAMAPGLLETHEPEREGPDFLDWIADRLVNVYGESEYVDFVVCLRRRANKARAAIAKATGGAE